MYQTKFYSNSIDLEDTKSIKQCKLLNDNISQNIGDVKLVMNYNEITIYHNDALACLKKIPSNSVRTVYIDPPFFTNKDFKEYSKNGKNIYYFSDKFINDNNGKPNINVYLEFMRPIIIEILRILTDDGTFYLHCDYHADANLRVLCEENGWIYNTSIAWLKATGGKFSTIGFDSVYDTIHVFNKSNNYLFNPQYESYSEDQIKQFKYKDEKGFYKLRSLKAGGTQVSLDRRVFIYEGCEGMWVNSEETLDELKRNNDLVIKNHILYRKQRPREGIKCSNLWSDINTTIGNELVNYPTQKPEALLERIIRASSNVGDTILDCFCGSGTSIAVGNRLKRNIIGCDASPYACIVTANRLHYPIKLIKDLCFDYDTILNRWNPIDFQNWVCDVFRLIRGKNGADGGFDGWFDYNTPVQIKQCQATRPHLSQLIGDINRENTRRKQSNEKYHTHKPLIQCGWFIAPSYSSDFISSLSSYSIPIKVCYTYEVYNKFKTIWENQQNIPTIEEQLQSNLHEAEKIKRPNDPNHSEFFEKLGVVKPSIFKP